MKKILILALLTWANLSVFAQSDYYWSSGKKNHLTTDSSTVIIKTSSSGDLKTAASRFNSLARPGTDVRNLDSVHMVIKYNSRVALTDVLKNFAPNTIKPGNAIYAHFYNKLPFQVTGTILYQLNDGKTIADVLAFLGKDEAVKQYVDGDKVVHLTPEHLNKVISIANKLYESGLVKWCHPDFIPDYKPTTNDPLYGNQYYLKNYGQNGGTSGVDINIEPVWYNLTPTTAVIRVAVIDNGVDAHEDLGTRLVAGYSAGVVGTGAPLSSVDGHGEACAGIVGATRDNSLDGAGICSSCQIVPVNIFTGATNTNVYDNNTSTSVGNIAAAIDWASSNDPAKGHADVLSCSWGGGTPADVITTSINNARALGRNGKGTIVVFSAGNIIPNNVPVLFPASVPGVISVGAIDKNGNRWNYSPNSPAIVAPTGNINYTGDVYTIDRMGANGYNAGNSTGIFGGTSAACPQVAGVAAMMLTINPTLTEAQVKSAILNHATGMGNTVAFGVGRLNAYAAISSVTPVVSGPLAFCSTGTYTVSNIPPGGTVAWTVSTPGVVSGPLTGSSITLTKVTQGYFTLTATITSGTTTLVASLYVTTVPALSGLSATMSGSCSNGYQTWMLVASPNMPPGTSWQWTVDNPASGTYNIFSPNSPSTYVSVSGGGGVSVTYTDPCGETSHRDGVTIYSPCGRANVIAAFPNPANDKLTVQNQVLPNTNSPAFTAQAVPADNAYLNDFEVVLYNDKGKVLKSGKNRKGNLAVVLNTLDIPDGTYYLHITQGKDKTEKQILIRH
jgi:hypothetical protein